jgi:hypothetical protein
LPLAMTSSHNGSYWNRAIHHLRVFHRGFNENLYIYCTMYVYVLTTQLSLTVKPFTFTAFMIYDEVYFSDNCQLPVVLVMQIYITLIWRWKNNCTIIGEKRKFIVNMSTNEVWSSTTICLKTGEKMQCEGEFITLIFVEWIYSATVATIWT